MEEKLFTSLGHAHEFELTLIRAGWKQADVTRLLQKETLATAFLSVVRDQAEVKPAAHIIDLDAEAVLPKGWQEYNDQHPGQPGWSVVNHARGGQLVWSPEAVRLHLEPEQKRGYIGGEELLGRIAARTYNANALDYLLQHPELIPDSWKGKFIYFFGTVYRGPSGRRWVRCLYWGGGRWGWVCGWLAGDWGSVGPVAVPASVA